MHQKLYAAFLENMPTSITMLDRDFRILACSHEWYRVHKRNPEETIGRYMFELFPTDDHWRDVFERALAGEIQKKDEDSRMVNGKLNWFKWEIRPWYIDGKIRGVIAYSENMNKYRETQEKLIQTSKMTSLGEMSSNIAHEINNPLSIVVARLRAMRDKVEKDLMSKEEMLKTIEKMSETALRITKIITGLREFSRDSEKDPFTIVSIQKIIDDTLELCRSRMLNNKIELQLGPVDSTVLTHCRPTQIEQVLLNLLNNAYDAVVGTESGWVSIETKTIGTHVEVSVTNSGPTIPNEIAEKMFLPFYTTKEVGQGTGLGLSISKGIIEAHEGELIHLRESPNTCFVIRLPRAFDNVRIELS